MTPFDSSEAKSGNMEQMLVMGGVFRQAVEFSTDPIAITKANQEIVYVNAAWQRTTGYSADEVVGKKPLFLLSSEMKPEQFDKAAKWVQHGDAYHSDHFLFQRKNGQQYNADITMYPIMHEETPLFIVHIHHDITRRKKEEQMKTNFISIASHQLRTPLTAIRWVFNILEKKADEKQLSLEEEQLIEMGNQSSQHMAELITVMLTLSRIEAGKISPSVEDVTLKDILHSIGEQEQVSISEKEIDFDIEGDVQESLSTDPGLLKEVIGNLVSNAIKYTPEHGSVCIKVHRSNDHIRIEVSDTGYGIPKEEQEEVGKRFFRGSNVKSGEIKGTGLGLNLVYEIVKLLGARISFLSKENQGTTFTVFFPVHA